MANKWQITLDVTKEEVALLLKRLSYLAEDAQQQVVAYDLKAKIELAWTERISDEDIALENYAHEAYQHAVEGGE